MLNLLCMALMITYKQAGNCQLQTRLSCTCINLVIYGVATLYKAMHRLQTINFAGFRALHSQIFYFVFACCAHRRCVKYVYCITDRFHTMQTNYLDSQMNKKTKLQNVTGVTVSCLKMQLHVCLRLLTGVEITFCDEKRHYLNANMKHSCVI